MVGETKTGYAIAPNTGAYSGSSIARDAMVLQYGSFTVQGYKGWGMDKGGGGGPASIGSAFIATLLFRYVCMRIFF